MKPLAATARTSWDDRFRTMPIHLAIASCEGAWYYCTSAHAHGVMQSRLSLEFSGELH